MNAETETRMAVCSYADGVTGKHGGRPGIDRPLRSDGDDSPWKGGLPFFRPVPERPYDRYYCGCWGWD